MYSLLIFLVFACNIKQRNQCTTKGYVQRGYKTTQIKCRQAKSNVLSVHDNGYQRRLMKSQ
jgi:hypothetical protein